ncbi:putative Nucleoside diphosphate kinase 7 [Hypsibius exemplaris]|uniref:Nucleoside diphosphate kinase 7 n=1 Tax=Hypsibius exemplaris TaxID=2072580 RepID=A0A1W0XCD1_HYPEX|nr:putative Nucleoside diphosphate kinase 7 [Hypsibius exemplaris]
MDQGECYCFEVIWDYEGTIRQFLLRFFPLQESVEMFDTLKHRSFVKRTRTPDLRLSHLNVGCTVSVLNRQLLVMKFADEKTRRAMEELFQRTAVVFKVNEHLGEVLLNLTGSSGKNTGNMTLTRIKMALMDREDILKLGLVGQCHFKGPVIAAEVTGADAVGHCQEVMGVISEPLGVQEFCYASPDLATADWTLRLLFDKPRLNDAACDKGILCLIKPHAVREGLVPRIMKSITDHGFHITAIETLVLERSVAERFLELYKSVLPEYLPWVDQLASGASVVLEVNHPEGTVYQRFRHLVGPSDPNVARTIRPNTLRAMYGRDKVHSGVHCTDLERDCQSDLEFIFRYIARPDGR